MNEKKEWRVFVIECIEGFDFRRAEYAGDYEAIMNEAENRGSVYSLEYFQDEINSENLLLDNAFILIWEV